ncbi:hypothetical protein Tco_1346848 [Tanacetum coccineum]
MMSSEEDPLISATVHIHNHRDHLGKFNEKADDGFFLGYSPMAKAFRVIEGDGINFNENRSSPDDKFLEPRSKATQCFGNIEYFPYILAYENITPVDSLIPQDSVSHTDPPEFTEADNHPTLNELDQHESVDIPKFAKIQDNVIIEPIINIIGKPLAGITTRSGVRDSEAASANECLYVNFLSEMEPKKLIKALEEEGLETIRIFLAYTSYMGLMVYQMNVKSTFLNGKISEEYDVADSALVKCPMLPPNNLGPDESGVSINETLFRGMIRLLMYLTASRSDIQFSTCLVLGLWYPKESGFDLKAYSDSDYAGCNLDRKSISKGYQIHGGKLVCWSAKKQSSVAMSSTKAEYVAAAGCCAQVL